MNEQMKINKQIARYYEDKGEENKSNKIQSLIYFQKAEKAYQKAFKLIVCEADSRLGFSRCLLKLSKFKNLLAFLHPENINYLHHYAEY